MCQWRASRDKPCAPPLSSIVVLQCIVSLVIRGTSNKMRVFRRTFATYHRHSFFLVLHRCVRSPAAEMRGHGVLDKFGWCRPRPRSMAHSAQHNRELPEPDRASPLGKQRSSPLASSMPTTDRTAASSTASRSPRQKAEVGRSQQSSSRAPVDAARQSSSRAAVDAAQRTSPDHPPATTSGKPTLSKVSVKGARVHGSTLAAVAAVKGRETGASARAPDSQSAPAPIAVVPVLLHAFQNHSGTPEFVVCANSYLINWHCCHQCACA